MSYFWLHLLHNLALTVSLDPIRCIRHEFTSQKPWQTHLSRTRHRNSRFDDSSQTNRSLKKKKIGHRSFGPLSPRLIPMPLFFFVSTTVTLLGFPTVWNIIFLLNLSHVFPFSFLPFELVPSPPYFSLQTGNLSQTLKETITFSKSDLFNSG